MPTRIFEASGSDFGLQTNYPNLHVSQFDSVTPDEFRHSQSNSTLTVSCHILCTSLFPYNPVFRHCIRWPSAGVIK